MANITGTKQEAKLLIPAKLAFERNIMPENGTPYVAIPNKNDLKLINGLSFNTGLKMKAGERPDFYLSVIVHTMIVSKTS